MQTGGLLAASEMLCQSLSCIDRHLVTASCKGPARVCPGSEDSGGDLGPLELWTMCFATGVTLGVTLLCHAV